MSAIIFDFDGTIADSRDYFIEFIAKEAGKHPLTKKQEKDLHGLSLTGVSRALGFTIWQMPGLYFKGRKKMDGVIRNIDPFVGMPGVIKKLNHEGHELFIVSSNSVRNIRIFLKKHGLREYFVEVYGGVEIFGKASMFHRLARENNLLIKDCVSIGDEVRDMHASKLVGMRAVAVSWGFSKLEDLEDLKPMAVVKSPKELLSVLEEI
jgi:phosphoglycolate phosphatase